MRKITTDSKRCTGCGACEMACSFYHTDEFSRDLSRIRVIKDELAGHDYPILCRQCQTPACVQACPTAALSRMESGTILLDVSLCTGCQLCSSVCPHGAAPMDVIRGVPLICDLCDGEPACVERCATEALKYEDPRKADSRGRLDIARKIWNGGNGT